MKRQKNYVNVDLTAKDVKPVINYDGSIIEDYFISSNGDVYHKTPKGTELCYCYLNKSGNDWKNGYYKVRINKHLYNLHWLLARAFVSGYKVGLCVDHIDNDSTNNAIENLQWITRGQNTSKFWKSLTAEELEAYKQKYSKGVKAGHDNGNYKKHLKLLHNKGE